MHLAKQSSGNDEEQKCLDNCIETRKMSSSRYFWVWLIREGRFNRKGWLNRDGWLIDLAKCSTIGIYDMITSFKHRNLRIKLKCYNYINFPYKMVCTWFIPLSLNRGGLAIVDFLTFDFVCCLEISIRPFLNLSLFLFRPFLYFIIHGSRVLTNLR